jgi:hypothetical protein
MLDDRSEHTTVSATIKSTPKLYPNIDEQQLQRDAKACLANYGTKFESSIVTATKGLYFYADGRKVLDWTSGQVCCRPMSIQSHINTSRCPVLLDMAIQKLSKSYDLMRLT